ncbi:hypothetical protein L3Q82_005678 [Scortum barcoo]|uniref:Uncharacterized protein n=1 Tax=Scortum barcoo TaxID=214431 RepID=A0ACB8V9A7_9TELE|nr:hypothetical protein L3Q82_005678 [Scortum barcoo]
MKRLLSSFDQLSPAAELGDIWYLEWKTLRRTSNYTVVQWPTVSDSVRPGDLMTLQCSVLSDSENKTCPGDHNVYWFKTGSDKSHPNIIYTDGNRHDECDKRSDTQKSCIYHLSKNIRGAANILNSDLMMALNQLSRGIENASPQAGHDNFSRPVRHTTEGGNDLNYAALHFPSRGTRGRKKRELKTEERKSFWSQEAKIVVFLLCAALAIIPVITFLIYTVKKNKSDCYTDSLVPEMTVQLGEPATFTCVSPGYESRGAQLYWYKQSDRDALKLIVILVKHKEPEYGPEFNASRMQVHDNISSLTILRTIQEDQGMYHCRVTEWNPIILTQSCVSQETLRGHQTILLFRWPTVSDSVRPGDLMTLQCSVLSDSENKTCPGDHNVYWFKTGSDKSHLNVIYTDGNTHDECDKRSDTQKSCIYRFSKSVSSSDAGTYYCAVATCGEILFGNGTKVEIEAVNMWNLKKANGVIILLCASLAISLIVIALLIYSIKKKTRDCNDSLVPETTVQLGEPATFTCDSPGYELRGAKLYWYKQSDSDALKLIVILVKHTKPEYGPEYNASRVEVKAADISSLTILRTIQEDEGLYLCTDTEFNPIILTQSCVSQETLRGHQTILLFSGLTVSDSVRPGDLMTLQCSVLSDSENKTCPGDHNVYWFKTGSDKSHLNIIKTDGNRHDECDKRSDTQKSCIYRFSKNISSSDAGTYYCAVATCGEILFGDGTKVETEEPTNFEFIALVISLVCFDHFCDWKYCFHLLPSSKTSM